MLSIIPKTDNITNTVSLVDENLLKVIIHINVAINNKIAANFGHPFLIELTMSIGLHSST